MVDATAKHSKLHIFATKIVVYLKIYTHIIIDIKIVCANFEVFNFYGCKVDIGRRTSDVQRQNIQRQNSVIFFLFT